MDIFEKTQTQESSKLKQKTKTQAKNPKKLKPQNSIMGICTQIIEFHKSKSHFMPRFPRFLAQSLVFIWKTQAQNSISGKFIWSICRNVVQFLSLTYAHCMRNKQAQKLTKQRKCEATGNIGISITGYLSHPEGNSYSIHMPQPRKLIGTNVPPNRLWNLESGTNGNTPFTLKNLQIFMCKPRTKEAIWPSSHKCGFCKCIFLVCGTTRRRHDMCAECIQCATFFIQVAL